MATKLVKRQQNWYKCNIIADGKDFLLWRVFTWPFGFFHNPIVLHTCIRLMQNDKRNIYPKMSHKVWESYMLKNQGGRMFLQFCWPALILPMLFIHFNMQEQEIWNKLPIHPSEEEDLTYSCSSGIWQTQMDTAAHKNFAMNHTTSLDVLVVKHLSIHNGNCWKNHLNTQGTQP